MPKLRSHTQRAVNDRLWSGGKRLVRHYVNRTLKSPEVVWLDTYTSELQGKTLELGCGAGRFTGHLAVLGGNVLATDVSPSMLKATSERYGVPTALLDLHDLGASSGGPYDAIILTANLIDVLDDKDRNETLGHLHDLLAPNGRLLFSSHNVDAAHLIHADKKLHGLGPLSLLRRFAQLPASVRNRRRLQPLERREAHYAVLNDMAHNWGVLHYYIGRDAQERQLNEHQLVLLSCLDLDGHVVDRDTSHRTSTELHYAARRET